MFSVVPGSNGNEKRLSSKTDLPEELCFLCTGWDYIKNVILDICLYWYYLYYSYFYHP